MELLSASRREAVRQIREQLCCMLCDRIFEDPQCLDCKHNFCRDCIFAHLSKHESKCPRCSIPIFPSEIMRNQFLQSILVAWKVVEHELNHMEKRKDTLEITVEDTDRALSGGGSQHLLSVATNQSSAMNTVASPATPASALGTPIPSRGPVANSKWNIDTKAILNEQKQPKRVTGIATSSPMRGNGAMNGGFSSASSQMNSGGNETSCPPTQMTQMTQMTPDIIDVLSPATRVASRRRSIFSPSQELAATSASQNSSVMPTQEVESYMERIQLQNKILNEWEQSRRLGRQAQNQSQSQQQSQSQNLKRQAPQTNGSRYPHHHQESGISAMGKLMKNWIASSQADKKPAARSLTAIIDAEVGETKRENGGQDANGDDEEDEEEESQTQMPPSGFVDSPDLLALSNGYAMPHLNQLNRPGAIGGRTSQSQVKQHQQQKQRATGRAVAASSLTLEEVVSRSSKKTAKRPANRQVMLVSPPQRSSGGFSESRKRAVSVASPLHQNDEDDDDDEETKGKQEDESQDEVDDSQAPGGEGAVHFDRYSRSSTATKTSSVTADFLRRRKKQRVSEDFGGAITTYRSQLQQQAAATQKSSPVSVQPVARLASLKSARGGILNGGTMARNGSASAGGGIGANVSVRVASAGGFLSPTALARPPLSNSARQQLVADIRKSNNFTIVATDLTNAECKRISTACSLLGGRFGLRFDLRPDPETGVLCSSVTHLIAKSAREGELRCKRTAKYMRALAEGCFVMDYSWVEASLEAGKWVREDDFEMIGDAYSDSVGKPHESHLQRVRTGRRNDLFLRFRFVLLCEETEFDYQIETLQGVVENFGATVISTTQYSKLSAARRMQKTQVGIVGKSTAPTDAKHKWEQHQIPIVRVAWLFDCISHLEVLPYDEYYPY